MRSTWGASTNRCPPGRGLASITMPSNTSAPGSASTCSTSPSFCPSEENTGAPASRVRYEAGAPRSISLDPDVDHHRPEQQGEVGERVEVDPEGGPAIGPARQHQGQDGEHTAERERRGHVEGSEEAT